MQRTSGGPQPPYDSTRRAVKPTGGSNVGSRRLMRVIEPVGRFGAVVAFTPVPRRRDHVQYEARQREILDAAVILFREQGYESARLEELAERVGLTKAAIYHYFPKKSDLLIGICERAIAESMNRQENILNSAEPVEVRFRRAISDHVEGMAKNVAVWDVFFREFELQDMDDARFRTIRRQMREFGDRFEQLLAEGVKREVFRPIDPRITANAILGMLNWSHRWISNERPENVSAVILQMLERGLFAEK